MKIISVFRNKQIALVLIALFNFSVVEANQAPADLIANNAVQEPKKTNYSIPDEMKKNLIKEMILVKGGSFQMGSNSDSARAMEKPQHLVTLNDFYIGKTEVTALLWEQIMGWNYSYNACDTCPVNNISWLNMQLFIERLNLVTELTFRLPTEAEWEYAARGGQKSKNYVYSGSNNIADVAWFNDNANRRSRAVAMKHPNELGLYDMTGNLWEFCHDDISRVAYSTLPELNPVLLKHDDLKKKSMKVVRGGGYDSAADESQVYRRDGSTNNVRMPDIGFRLAMNKK